MACLGNAAEKDEGNFVAKSKTDALAVHCVTCRVCFINSNDTAIHTNATHMLTSPQG